MGLLDGLYAQLAAILWPWLVPAVAVAVVSLPAGLGLMSWASRRRFHRRNFAGVEEFGSWGQSVGHRLLESVIELLARVFLAAGIIALAAAIGAVAFGRYRDVAPSTSSASAIASPSASVDVGGARRALKDSAPNIYRALTDPGHPKTAAQGGTVSYEWTYLDKKSGASVQVKRIRITLDTAGKIVGVTNP